MGTVCLRMDHTFADRYSCCAALGTKLIKGGRFWSDTTVIGNIRSAHWCGKHTVGKGASCNGDGTAKMWKFVCHNIFSPFLSIHELALSRSTACYRRRFVHE